jgi:uncharacterized protein (TIGR02271 family)
MARTYPNLGENLEPLSELHGFTIEKDDPDPRGWTVVSQQGQRIGKVDDLIVDKTLMKVRYLVVDREDTTSREGITDRHVLVPINDVDVHASSRQVVARTWTGSEMPYDRSSSRAGYAAEAGQTRTDFGRDQARLTRSEEELDISKHEVTREARVGKHVETERVSQPVTRRREEPVIERRPVEAGARGDASISDDEVRIPLKEEELVVDKRPVVKEELVVGKRTVEERDSVEADVRREKFDVDPETRGPDRGGIRGRGNR